MRCMFGVTSIPNLLASKGWRVTILQTYKVQMYKQLKLKVYKEFLNCACLAILYG